MGAAGKDFVRETVRLLKSFAEGTALAAISLKAVMLLPSLLLQKPPLTSAKSRAKEHAEHLSRRLRAWRAGEFDGLSREQNNNILIPSGAGVQMGSSIYHPHSRN